jgi:hypothetical protein
MRVGYQVEFIHFTLILTDLLIFTVSLPTQGASLGGTHVNHEEQAGTSSSGDMFRL